MKEVRTKIRGVTYDDPRSGLNRQKIIKRYVRAGMRLYLEPEDENSYESDAIMILLRRSGKMYHLGYVGSELSQWMGSMLRSGRNMNAWVTEVTGGTRKKKSRGVNILIQIDDEEPGAAGTIRPASIPESIPKQTRPARKVRVAGREWTILQLVVIIIGLCSISFCLFGLILNLFES